MKAFYLIITVFVLTNCRPKALEMEAPEINSVKPGTKFRVNLPEDHRTGYTWQLKEGFDKSVVMDLSAVWHGNEKGIDFNFNGLAQGQTTLTFVERKYTDTLHVKSFIVKITPE